MTWDELKEKAKEMGACVYVSTFRDNHEMIGFKNIYIHNDDGEIYISVNTQGVLAGHRTPEQMLAIMKALQ